jgi:hypothetical protein
MLAKMYVMLVKAVVRMMNFYSTCENLDLNTNSSCLFFQFCNYSAILADAMALSIMNKLEAFDRTRRGTNGRIRQMPTS